MVEQDLTHSSVFDNIFMLFEFILCSIFGTVVSLFILAIGWLKWKTTIFIRLSTVPYIISFHKRFFLSRNHITFWYSFQFPPKKFNSKNVLRITWMIHYSIFIIIYSRYEKKNKNKCLNITSNKRRDTHLLMNLHNLSLVNLSSSVARVLCLMYERVKIRHRDNGIDQYVIVWIQ